MLEDIFGSRTRTKLLHLFLENPDQLFFVRELTREINEKINSVRRELENLADFGLLIHHSDQQKKFYRVDKNFVLFNELTALFAGSRLLLEKALAKEAVKLSGLKYLVLTGQLVNSADSPTDILLVGEINEKQLNKFIKIVEGFSKTPIRYTHFSMKEFNLRRGITDKFIYNILNGPKIELINKFNEE